MQTYDMKTLPVEPRVPTHQRLVDTMDVIYSRLMQPKRRSKLERTPGAGQRRAAALLKAKRKANKAIPDTEVRTRQQFRRSMILRGRQKMTIARKEVMQRGIRGGGAIIRNPVDVARVLG